MGVTPSDEVDFDEDDLAPVVAILDELGEAHRGWVNFVPEVEPEVEVPPRSILAKVFSARGDAVPLATWLAPEEPGGRATLGIEHGSGPKALEQLATRELALPPGWFKRSDHPRRGLVVTVPHAEPSDDVLWWLLTASHLLSPPPLTGSWLARVYRPT